MLTRRGWTLLEAAPVLALAGRLLGVRELDILAVACLTAVAAGVASVRLRSLQVEASRVLRPHHAHFGTPARAQITFRNPGFRPSPGFEAVDGLGEGDSTSSLIDPLSPGAARRVSYPLPTDHRGRFTIGPLRGVLHDPLGVARREVPLVGPASFVVFPRVEDVPPLPPGPGNDPEAAVNARSQRSAGEDFYAVRPYEMGDDLRRVHWASTARVGDLMVRQQEQPWQQRATIVCDVRRSVHTADTFEQVLSTAAGLLTSTARVGAVLRLVTTGGADTGWGTGPAHAEAGLALLAGARPTGAANLHTTLGRLQRDGVGSTCAVVTTSASGAGDMKAIDALTRSAMVLAVLVGPAPAAGGTRVGSTLIVRVPVGAPAGPALRAHGRLAGRR